MSTPWLCFVVVLLTAGQWVYAQDDDDPDEGRKGLFGKLRKLSPKEEEMEEMVEAAQEAHEQGQYAQAIALVNRVLTLNPRHAVALHQRAVAQVELGREQGSAPRIRAGLEDARQALAIDGNEYPVFHIPYFYGLTSLAELEGKKSHAELCLQIARPLARSERLEPEVREAVYLQIALACNAMADYKGAADAYNQALRINDTEAGAFLGRAEALAKLDDPQVALMAYEDTIRRFPTEAMAYNNRGAFLLEKGRLEQARNDFTQALEHHPQMVMALLNRGYSWFLDQNWPAAEKDFVSALEIDPNFLLARRYLGSTEFALGKVAEAVKLREAAGVSAPTDPDVLLERGIARLRTGSPDKAAQDLQATIAARPGFAEPRVWLFFARIQAGQAELAANELNAWIAKPGGASWDLDVAKVLVGKSTEEALFKLAEQGSENDRLARKCVAHFYLGMQAALRNDRPSAQKHWEESLKTGQTRLPLYHASYFELRVRPNLK